MPNELSAEILKIVEEITTPIVAKSALTVHCKHLNVTLDTLTTAQIDQLCEKIASGFSSFGVDSSKISSAVNKKKCLNKST